MVNLMLISGNHLLVNNSLVNKGKRKSFLPGLWQHLFTPFVQEANQYCSIMFVKHVNNKPSARCGSSNLLFRINGYCNNTDCPVKNMILEVQVKITFNATEVCHQFGEFAAWSIRSAQHQQERE